jgi:hypothetical protein
MQWIRQNFWNVALCAYLDEENNFENCFGQTFMIFWAVFGKFLSLWYWLKLHKTIYIFGWFQKLLINLHQWQMHKIAKSFPSLIFHFFVYILSFKQICFFKSHENVDFFRCPICSILRRKNKISDQKGNSWLKSQISAKWLNISYKCLSLWWMFSFQKWTKTWQGKRLNKFRI